MTGLTGVRDAERSFAEHEHRELIVGISELEGVADKVGRTSPASLAYELRRLHWWYRTVMEPHRRWEEQVLYPEIDERAGTDWATRMMRYEHQQIARVVTRLERDIVAAEGNLTHEQVCDVRSHLYVAAGLLRAHVEREDLFLLPLLAG